MSILTNLLKLFKYTQEDRDNKVVFNVGTALNENWDKIEANAAAVKEQMEQITDIEKNSKYTSTQQYALISLEGISVSDLCNVKINGIYSTSANNYETHIGFRIASAIRQTNNGYDLEKIKIISLNSINYLAVLLPSSSTIHVSPIYNETLAKTKNPVVTFVTDISSYTLVREATKSLVATTDKIDISSLLANGWAINGTCVASKQGNQVTISAPIKNGTVSAGTILFTLPLEYRPIVGGKNITVYNTDSSSNVTKTALALVNTNGDVNLVTAVTSGALLVCGSYVI